MRSFLRVRRPSIRFPNLFSPKPQDVSAVGESLHEGNGGNEKRREKSQKQKTKKSIKNHVFKRTLEEFFTPFPVSLFPLAQANRSAGTSKAVHGTHVPETTITLRLRDENEPDEARS